MGEPRGYPSDLPPGGIHDATTGRQHVVDHIIPLQGRTVSGLHVETNLRVVEHHENARKHNTWESPGWQRPGDNACTGRDSEARQPFLANMKHAVTRFKSLKEALGQLQRFVRNGAHLQSGPKFEQMGGSRLREALANWLLCVAINSVTQPDRLTFTSDPVGGDWVILDTSNQETWPTEHVMVPNIPRNNDRDIQTLITEAIEHKNKRGPTYARGKTLVVFLNAAGGPWSPDEVARRLPSPFHFEAAWVVALHHGDPEGEYIYDVTRLDLSRGHAPVWRVRIAKGFDGWGVEPLA